MMVATFFGLFPIILLLGTAAAFSLPEDAPDGVHLLFHDPESNENIALHESQFTPEIRRLLSQKPPSRGYDDTNGSRQDISQNQKRTGAAVFDSTQMTVDPFDLYEAILDFEWWVFPGRTINWADSTSSLALATYKINQALVYMCTNEESVYIDDPIWMQGVWPALDPAFQQNQDNYGIIRSAYYTPDSTIAFGFTVAGQTFCQFPLM